MTQLSSLLIEDPQRGNIKIYIHDEKVWEAINKHEKKVYAEFYKRMNNECEKLKDVKPFHSWSKYAEINLSLRYWRSQEMLNFYDKLSKEHDI